MEYNLENMEYNLENMEYKLDSKIEKDKIKK